METNEVNFLLEKIKKDINEKINEFNVNNICFIKTSHNKYGLNKKKVEVILGESPEGFIKPFLYSKSKNHCLYTDYYTLNIENEIFNAYFKYTDNELISHLYGVEKNQPGGNELFAFNIDPKNENENITLFKVKYFESGNSDTEKYTTNQEIEEILNQNPFFQTELQKIVSFTQDFYDSTEFFYKKFVESETIVQLIKNYNDIIQMTILEENEGLIS